MLPEGQEEGSRGSWLGRGKVTRMGYRRRTHRHRVAAIRVCHRARGAGPASTSQDVLAGVAAEGHIDSGPQVQVTLGLGV